MKSAIIISLLLITPLGFTTKLYHGVGAWWVNDYFGGVLYEIFWILFIVLVWPKISIFWTILGVLVATSVLEVLQLWHPPFLKLIRMNFLGRTLIGTSFSWWDFPHYILGCLIGWFWLRLLKQKTE